MRYVCVSVLCVCVWSGYAGALTIDADKNEVSVHSGFSGGEITVFGTIRRDENVVVLVLGPREDVKLYEKHRVLGFWVNRLLGKVEDVPSFYGLLMNNSFLSSETKKGEILLHFHEIGLDRLRLEVSDEIEPVERRKMRNEVINIQKKKGLYFENERGVKIVEGDLFKAKVRFPKETPTGVFRIKVLTFDGEDVLRHVRVIPVFVKKRGLVSFVAHFAKIHPVIYGAGVVTLSLCVGLFIVFLRRRRV